MDRSWRKPSLSQAGGMGKRSRCFEPRGVPHLHHRIWSVLLQGSRFPRAHQQPQPQSHLPAPSHRCPGPDHIGSGWSSFSLSDEAAIVPPADGVYPLEATGLLAFCPLEKSPPLRQGKHQGPQFATGRRECWESNFPAPNSGRCRQGVSSPAPASPEDNSPSGSLSSSPVTLNRCKLSVSG